MAWGNRPCFCGDSLLCRSGLPVSGIDFGTGRDMNLHCGATRLLCRERCVQRSLPCVNRSGKKSYASRLMALSAERFLWKDCLQKRIRTGKSRCGNHLGCPCGAEMGLRYGLSGNRVSVLETDRLGYERETASSATRGSSMGKTNPT